MKMNRKNFIKLAATSGLMIYSFPGFAVNEMNVKTTHQLPSGFKAIIDNLLSKDPGFWNTDWEGTMAIESLLGLKNRGVPEALGFAKNWLDYHIENDNKLTDEELYKTFSGPRSRIIRGKYLPFTMYSGFFGLPFPCYEIYKETGDERAKQVCLDVADAILQVSARDQRGLVLHDDGIRNGKIMTFTIPDTMYFVTKALMIASVLDDKIGKVYRDQALFQIKTGTSFYLDNEKNIARTVLYPSGVGRTFWCRASGWLSYALAGVLRFLPNDHPEFENLAHDLKRLADGVKKYQGASGGLRVLVDQPTTPEETSGTAMCIASIKEAVDKGWIPNDYTEFLERGWEFVKNHVSNDGKITGIYTGWAIPAEEGKIIMDQLNRESGWIPAVILHTANLMT
jgi:rhamnogalacturonyl hydrolase YesR